MTPPAISRRTLGGVTLLGAATPLLAGCGEDTTPPAAPTGGEALVAASEVPVSGGVVLTDARMVVTQPAEGTFKCFSAICTHKGCTVGDVSENQITCACHGSVFSAEDGSVVDGPADEPLKEYPVTVEDGQVTGT